ncbi:MAG TPA: hypothetical protein DHO02_09335 [Syntrophaceae bacterium]|nr:hypothetical protein [Syntrophaceae bacterium]HCX02557.1 hypothetical protein [Syntrophaceae bacterium]
MKRFWLVFLSLGLIVAFSSTAMAVDVKLSGEFYVGGMYLDKTSFTKTTTGGNPSTAFYYQRLRARTDFTVSPGLKLITRFDAMERAWGAARFAPGVAPAADSAGTVAENENIAIDWVYIDYKSAIGTFLVGYMNYGTTGTVFGNNQASQARIRFIRPVGPIMMYASMSKVKENSKTAINPVPPATAAFADSDNDVYHLEGVYNWKNGRAGLNVNYYNYANTRPAAVPAANGSYRRTYFLFTPYVIAKFGPVSVQAEFNYLNGNDKYEDGVVKVAGVDKVTLENISAYIDATANFGMFYAGGSIAYVSGDDPGTNDKNEGGLINGGRDWNPCLIMFNYYDRAKWGGNLTGYGTTADTGLMANAWFFQFRGGVKPIDKLDVMASLSYANADKKPNATYLYNDYGWEVDLTATYKITNNLSYMVGAGYLFTGKYYKANLDANELNDDFLVINKLTLTF